MGVIVDRFVGIVVNSLVSIVVKIFFLRGGANLSLYPFVELYIEVRSK